jgi:chromosomal replication initiator protein
MEIMDLCDRYVFNTYFAEPTDLTFLVAKMITAKPGKEYNPVLFYGKSGSGKTHLIQAIGNEMKTSNLNVVYTSCESIVHEFITALQKSKRTDFMNKYMHLDALLIDDLQFLRNLPATTAELLLIFDILFARNVQVVFTCDKNISKYQSISRLISGIGGCLMIPMPYLDHSAKCEVIKKIAQREDVVIEQDAIKKIALETEQDIGYVISHILAIKLKNDMIANTANKRQVLPQMIV